MTGSERIRWPLTKLILHNLKERESCLPRVEMAAFKLPYFSEKRRPPLEFPEFSWISGPEQLRKSLEAGRLGQFIFIQKHDKRSEGQ